MRSRTSTVLILVAVMAPPSTSGAPPIGDARLAAAGLTKFWTATVPLVPQDRVDAVYRVDDTVYVISRNGSIYSLQADVGLIRWAEKLAAPDSLIRKPIHFWTSRGDGPVGILAGEGFFVLDRYSGDRLFHAVDELNLGGRLAAAGRSVFAGGLDGRVRSLKLLGNGGQEVLERWQIAVGSPVTAAPLLFGQQDILFAAQSGLVIACSAIDKSFRWRFRAGGGVFGDPAVNGSGVYVAGMGGSLYKLDGRSGQLVWRVRFPGPLAEGPVATSSRIYQHCDLNGLFCVDAASGQKLWNLKSGKAFLAELPGRVAAQMSDGRLVLVDNQSGTILAEFDAGEAVTAAENRYDDAIYLAYADGRVVSLRPSGSGYLTGAKAEAARDRLRLPPTAANRGESSASPSASPPRADDSDVDILRSRRDKN
ncbi:MAG: PQQ-binding-like beta-propeller repeat protein [Phycisphaerae bacterium]